jgi:hypothetical protein
LANSSIQVGSVVVSHVTGFTTTWVALLTLLSLHLSLNYAAVRAVQMTSLNRQRANIVLSTLFESDTDISLTGKSITFKKESTSQPGISQHPQTGCCTVLTPAQVASQERIFHRDSALQWTSRSRTSTTYLGSAEIGISLDSFFRHARRYSSQNDQRKSASFQTVIPMTSLTTLFADESYILFLFPSTAGSTSTWHASILLKKGCTVMAQLKGWAHALLAARELSESTLSSSSKETDQAKASQDAFDVVAGVLAVLNRGDRFGGYVAALQAAGWDVDVGALETRGGRRVSLD